MGTIRSPGLTNGITACASGTNKHSMLRCWYTVQIHGTNPKTKAKNTQQKTYNETTNGSIIGLNHCCKNTEWCIKLKKKKKSFVGLFLCFMNDVVKQGLHLIVLEKCAAVNGVYVTPWAPKPTSLILGGGASLQMVWGPSQGQTSWILDIERHLFSKLLQKPFWRPE